ncbi:MAG TPA: response regulator transcription factor [Aggregatilineaceae bacterium]|nr:response regulator transcription factor [Aggregatilineaceae bacterium]
MELVREKRPDVLLLDLNMPGTSGLDILPEIRASLPEVKVLVLTGRDEDLYIIRALRAGAHGYILKTSGEESLVQAVKDVAAGHLVLGHGVAERVAQGFMNRAETKPQAALGDLDRAILTGVAAGMTNEQIAEKLRLDSQLVDAQLMLLLEQMGARSRTDASLMALRQGLILLDDLHNF